MLAEPVRDTGEAVAVVNRVGVGVCEDVTTATGGMSSGGGTPLVASAGGIVALAQVLRA